MIEFVALPLLAAYLTAYAATALHRRLPARLASWASITSLTLILLAATPTIWLMAFSGLRHVGIDSPLSDWSHHLLPDLGPAGALLGVAASVVTVVGLVRAVRVVRLRRRLCATAGHDLEILPSDAVFAYTLPGPGGNIVVSQGLVNAVSETELSAVIAHERSHARNRHDRHLLLARLAVALLPMTNHLAKRLEFSIERWADRDAAMELGDPRLIARAIARVALAGDHSPAMVNGIARFGAAARAEALLQSDSHHRRARHAAIASLAALGITFAASALQLHHTIGFGASLLA